MMNLSDKQVDMGINVVMTKQEGLLLVILEAVLLTSRLLEGAKMTTFMKMFFHFCGVARESIPSVQPTITTDHQMMVLDTIHHHLVSRSQTCITILHVIFHIFASICLW